MLVTKIFNNNSVIAIDKDNREVIVRGKALGFKYKVGNELKECDIEKIYVLQDESIKENFIKLLDETPKEYFDITEKIIVYAKEHIKGVLNEHIYIALADHINFAIARANNNIPIVNRLLVEVKKLYPEEFKVGLYGVHLISTNLGINLTEDEAANIAFHLVNAKQDKSNIEKTIAMTKIIKDILNIVKYHFNITLEEESLNCNRFITHLQFFVQRLLEDNILESDEDDFLYGQIIKKYPEEFNCATRIMYYIQKSTRKSITKDEIIYLVIHINRIVNRKN